MKIKEFFGLIEKVIDENNDALFTAWLTGRNFEKWLQLELLTKLTEHYDKYSNEFDSYFHSEYRASLDQRGGHEKKYKQVDLYIANGKNDSNDYMYIELKTGFGKYISTPVAGVIDDLYWLKKIKEHDAKQRIAVLMLLSCEAAWLDDAREQISLGAEKKPLFHKKFTISKNKKTVYVLSAIWKA